MSEVQRRHQRPRAPHNAALAIAGQKTITDKGTIGFPRALKRYSRKLRTEFEFTKCQVRASSCAVWEAEIRATSWIGGTDSTLRQDGLDKCDPTKLHAYEGGATFSRDTNKATRYTRAVEAFGVNLTSRSGFSKNVTLDYGFGRTSEQAPLHLRPRRPAERDGSRSRAVGHTQVAMTS